MPESAVMEYDVQETTEIESAHRICPCCHAIGEGCVDCVCHGFDAD